MRTGIFLRVAATFGLLLIASALRAQEIPLRAELLATEENGYVLSADFPVQLSDKLDSVLSKGVPLYFIVEFETTRSRWYWFAERIATKRLEMRLAFHAITRTYRLSIGSQHQSFNSLYDALRAMGTVRGWHVINPGSLEPLSKYDVGVRVYLDTVQLPTPFQLSATINPEWTLASAWQRWGIATDAQGRIVK